MVRLECDRTMFVQGGRTQGVDVLAGRCAGKAGANVGSVFHEKALSGDIRALLFYLKTQGG